MFLLRNLIKKGIIMDDSQKHEVAVVDSSRKQKIGRIEVVHPHQQKPKKTASRFLVRDKAYAGEYVAMPSFNDRAIIAHGTDRTAVRGNAKKQGYEHPVIHYVSEL